jgi:hypothetical protein
VSLQAERKEAEINRADYSPAEGPIDPNFKPEVFTFTIKCKYGPNQPPEADPKADPAKQGKKK